MRKPSLVTRAKVALGVFRHGFPVPKFIPDDIEVKKAPFLWPDWRGGRPQWQLIDFESYVGEGFNINAIVYGAIMYKVRAMMQAPLRAYKGDPDNPDLAPDDSDLSKLIFRPNPWQSFIQFQSQNIVYLNLAGNVYIYFDRVRGQDLPAAMYTLRPDRVYVRPDRKKGKGILGYLYVPEGKAILDGEAILPQDMIHIKLPNPGDPLEGLGYGLSPLSAIARVVNVDNAITHFLKLFFDKGIVVPGILSTEQPLTESVVARMRERWKEVYGGYRQWAEEIGILERGMSYQRVGLTFDEMGFDALDERSESRILGPFGVAPILTGTRVGLKRATYSNFETARQATWEDTLVPELKLFEVAYQYYLQYKNQWVKFDTSKVPALIEAASQRREEARLAYEGAAVTRNEYRTMLGYPALPGGDVFKVPFNIIFVPAFAQPTEQETPAPVEAEEDEREEEKEVKSLLSNEHKILFWKQMDAQAVAWEGRFGDAAKEAFENDLRYILAIVSGAKQKALERKATPDWFEAEGEAIEYLRTNENWTAIFASLLAELITDRGNYLNEQFGMDYDIADLIAQEWFKSYTIRFAQPINETTEEAIRAMFGQAMGEGWSIPEMSKRLELMFQQWMNGDIPPEEFEWYAERLPRYRRDLIARTETISASNVGSQELYRAWGVMLKEWLATPDDRVRPSHAGASGQVRPMDEPFDVGGAQLMYPGDKDGPAGEICNCRCTVLPVIE